MAGRINVKNLKRGMSYLKRNGISSSYYKAIERLKRDEDEAGYSRSVLENCLSIEEVIRQRQTVFKKPVLISIIVPTYKPDEMVFRALLESVAASTYTNWELIIADASSEGSVKDLVQEFVLRHSLDPKGAHDTFEFKKKVVYKHLDNNRGISINTNAALEFARGDYIAFLDHDDVITQDALFEVVSVINNKSGVVGKLKEDIKVKYIYSDEDKVSYDGQTYFDHHKKYDYDPALILTNNYICHLSVVAANLVKQVGGLNPEFDGSQDFDFALRCFENIKNEEIVHIPKVLYHWRSSKGSTAENPDSKLYAYEAGKRAVAAHLERLGVKATVNNTAHLGFFRVIFDTPEGSICTMDAKAFASMNEDSFEAITEDYIMVLSDNLEGSEGFADYLKGAMALEFAGATTGKIIKNKKVESAGYNLDKRGGIIPCFSGLNEHFSGYLHRASLLRCVDAYDMGCVLLKRNAIIWNQDGPVLKDGYRCVYVPEAKFRRKEGNRG